jgi:RimJ/RimL family protein N-acetyltransferase
MQISLRRWEMSDAKALTIIANNINIWNNVRDRMPHPYHLEDARRWITETRKENPAKNFCIMYDGWVAGSVGIQLYDDVYRCNAEIGYFVAEPYWRNGIATEAVKLMSEYAFKNFDLERLFAVIFADNTASARVLQKNGFYLESIRRKIAVKAGLVRDDMVWVKWKA